MSFQVFPKSTAGKWSVRLCLMFFALIGLFFGFVSAGQRGGMKFFDNLALALPIMFAAICSTVALILGLISIIKHQDRALLIFVSIAIGVLVVYFTIGEWVSMH